MFLQEAALCVPPLEQSELQRIWNSARKFGERISSAVGYIPPDEYNAQSTVREFLDAAKPEQNRLYSWTDIGASRLFADCFKEVARFVPERKSWYIYGNGVWSADVGSLRAMELCKELADEIVRYALSIADEQKRQEYLKYCSKWQSRRVRETILKDAQGIHPIAMREFDSDPYIFNCKNGTLHLRSMKHTGFGANRTVATQKTAETSIRRFAALQVWCESVREKAAARPQCFSTTSFTVLRHH